METSNRSKVAMPIMLQGLLLQQQNPYSTENPNGIINGGVAENTLALKWLIPQFTEIKMSKDHFKYGELQGSTELRQLIADLFNRHLHTNLNCNQISLHNGCGSVLENLIFNLCDAGDEVLITQPYYGGFEMDVQFRMDANVVAVPTVNYRLTASLLEEAIKKCKSPKALIICNPDNPTGIAKSHSEIVVATEFCKKHNIHLISDEIYALTAYNGFKSIFHPDYSALIDKSMTHMVWSFSKDFCMNGIRCGAFFSFNLFLVEKMHNSCYFSAISRFADIHLVKFLKDTAAVDAFLANNREICLKYLSKAIDFCTTRDIPFVVPNGGFFIYLDLSKFLVSTEYELFTRILKLGVYMPRGEAFFDLNKGWFRLTYAVEELDLLLERLNAIA
eukprot:NODE_86_length_22163_cov_0.379442.p6 type:complete len:389 gc:universal NODE_86_length_22163_cov_0.379442:5868-7034(+)